MVRSFVVEDGEHQVVVEGVPVQREEAGAGILL